MNCIRTEEGYCAIQWKESSTTSPDPFFFGVADAPGGTNWANTAASGAAATLCGQFVFIPGLSKDGITKIPNEPGVKAFQSQVCGTNFGIEMTPTATGIIPEALVSKYLS